ncbi:phytanoyl-CoA dioxygenase family protein [Planctomicrobium sp. SH664]|uniref:phytanoyl-CoA dioxygenase family protein n=1 Tax=Planctomicrobium sp. SH664 TaxID=3448125 RepID=UPI003F5B3D18
MTTQVELEPPSIEFTSEELQNFHQQGYAIVRGLSPETLRQRMLEVTKAGVQQVIEPVEYEADLKYPGAPASALGEGGRTIRRLKQALSRDISFVNWVQHPGVVGRLKQLLGPNVVCPLAHHNCIMTKEPRFSSDTGWHQDIRYWSYTRPELISVWLALGPERAENGCLQLIPGSHRAQYSKQAFDEAVFFRDDLPENQQVLSQRILAELNPGDVLFFHCRTLHAATRNRTQDTKFSVVFTFRGLDNPPLPGSRSASAPELLIP